MYRIFFLMLLLLPSAALADNTTYYHIRRVAPHLSLERTARYARLILREAKRFHVDPQIVVAIVAQESMFRPISTKRTVLDRQLGLIEVNFDLGLMQVNAGTALGYGFDIDRLIEDDEYQVRSGVQVLADKIRACTDTFPDTPWGCYHSATPKYHSIYIELVRRWL